MKKLIVLIVLLSVCLTGCRRQDYTILELDQHITTEIPVYNDETDFAKVDYPLIDVEFEEGYMWTVIIRNEYTGEGDENIWISQDKSSMENYREYIRVNTFPIGRGTTPNGYIYIYKDNELVKSVPYTEIEFGKEDVKEVFFNITSKEIENQLDITLPPFI